MELAAEGPGKGARLLLGRAQLHDGWTNGAEREKRQGHAGPMRLLDEDHLIDRAPSLTAVLHRPTEPEPPVFSHPSDGRDIVRPAGVRHLRHQLGKVRPEGGLQFALRLAQLQTQGTSLTFGNIAFGSSSGICLVSWPGTRTPASAPTNPARNVSRSDGPGVDAHPACLAAGVDGEGEAQHAERT